MSKRYRVENVLSVMWMVVGLIQLAIGNEVVGMLDMIVGVQFITLSEMEKEK